MSKHCVISALLIMLSVSAVKGEALQETTLVDFGLQGALSTVLLRDVTGKPVKHWAMSASRGADLTYLRTATSATGQVWPAVVLNHGQSYKLSDWQGYDELHIELFNPGRFSAPLTVQLRELAVEGKGSRRVNSLSLGMVPPGRKFVGKVYLKRLQALGRNNIDLSRVGQVDLYMDTPVHNYRLVVGRISLVRTGLQPVWEKLHDDYSKYGFVSAAVTLNRPVQLTLGVKDADGKIVAEYSADARSISWRFMGFGKDNRELPTGKYSMVLVANDASNAQARLEQELFKFEIPGKKEHPDTIVWPADATDKVMLFDSPSGKTSENVNLLMARNEKESTQVVLLSRKDRSGVKVRVRNLRHKATGKGFPASGISVRQVGYVKTADPGRFHVDYVGWWPDALIPADEMHVKAGLAMPVWLTFKTDKATQSGEYEGTVEFTGKESRLLASIPLMLTVADVTLPDKTRAVTAISYQPGQFRGGQSDLYKDRNVRAKVVESVHEMFVANRINLTRIYRPSPPAIDFVKKYFESPRLNAFCISQLPFGNVNASDTQNRQRLHRYFRNTTPFLEQCRKLGIENKAYFYGADEIYSGQQFASMKKGFSLFKKSYPQVPIVTTAIDPTYGLRRKCDDVIDVWVPLVSHLDKPMAAAARKRGRRFWWYICDVPMHPYPNWRVDCSGTETRLLWWMSYLNDIEGVLYWAADYTSHVSPLSPNGCNQLQYNPVTIYNGDGSLVLPGQKRAWATIRLELIRDGIEDFELLWMLAERSGQKDAKKLCRKLIKTTYDFSRSNDEFQDVRKQLLMLLAAE